MLIPAWENNSLLAVMKGYRPLQKPPYLLISVLLFPATCSGKQGLSLCLGSWVFLLSWLTQCPENKLVKLTPQLNLNFSPIIFPLCGTIVWSIYCAIESIFKKHYPLCSWFVKFYSFHSEPMLNKFLPKTISISEHNLPNRNKTEIELKVANLPSYAWKVFFSFFFFVFFWQYNLPSSVKISWSSPASHHRIHYKNFWF